MRKKIRAVALILIPVLLLGMNSSLFDAVKIHAKTTQEQIRDKEDEKNELENRLEDQKGDLGDLKQKERSLQSELAGLNEQMTLVSERLELLEGQISEKNGQIEQTRKELENAISTEEWQYESMLIRVRKMYERNESNYITSLMQAGSLGNLLNLANWFERVEVYDKDKLREYQTNRGFIEEVEERLRTEMAELDNLKLEAEVEKNKVAGLISQVAVRISDYADQIEEAEKKALEYEAQLKKNEEDLKALRKKLEEEIRLSQTAANGAWRNISDVNFADGDRKLLANIIYCEAGSEPYEGKVAVGAVVINRVLSDKFPDTVVGVIYQRGQFSPVQSGRLEIALASDLANADCYKAADEAMGGKTNVGNCVFFRTPIPGLTGINIGNHVFY